MSDYYDKNGEPLALMQWVALIGDHEYKRVALDEIGGATVSTVWLGSDHGLGHGLPLIFETMVFGGTFDGEQERYSTLELAQAGHAVMVQRVRNAIERGDHAEPPHD